MKNRRIYSAIFAFGITFSASVVAEAETTTVSSQSNIKWESWDKGVAALNAASRAGIMVKDVIVSDKTITVEGMDGKGNSTSDHYATDEVRLVSEKKLLTTGAATPLAAKQISAVLQAQMNAGAQTILEKVDFDSMAANVTWVDAQGKASTVKVTLPRVAPVDEKGKVLATGVSVL